MSLCSHIDSRVSPEIACARRGLLPHRKDGAREERLAALSSRDLLPNESAGSRCASSCSAVPQRAERSAFAGGGVEPLRPFRAHAPAGPPISSRNRFRRLNWYLPSRLHYSISRLLDFSMANASPDRFRPWSRLVTRACASDCIQNEDVVVCFVKEHRSAASRKSKIGRAHV